MAPIYIDETAGSDTTGKGTLEEPYQSLALALFNHGETTPFQIRKSPEAEYDEPTQSALKKGKKNAAGIEKKRKKQEELAEREAKEQSEEKERRERLLEESKKIVLEEDPSLPRATKVRCTASPPVHDSLMNNWISGKNCSSHRAQI
jgi:asparaginyl-tRNA synthetase